MNFDRECAQHGRSYRRWSFESEYFVRRSGGSHVIAILIF